MLKWASIEAELGGIRQEMTFVRDTLNSDNVFHSPIYDEMERLRKRLERFRAVIECAKWEDNNCDLARLLRAIREQFDVNKNSELENIWDGRFHLESSFSYKGVDDMWDVFFSYLNQP